MHIQLTCNFFHTLKVLMSQVLLTAKKIPSTADSVTCNAVDGPSIKSIMISAVWTDSSVQYILIFY